MNTESNKLYDLKELRLIAAGDDGFETEMVNLFIDQVESALTDMKNQLENGDYVEIKAILHKMKPSFMVMGVVTVTEIIEKIEKMDFSALDKSAFSDLWLKLEAVLREVNYQLRNI